MEIISGPWKGQLGMGLAPRELQYVMSAAQGMTAKEIAKMFGISPGSVVNRLSSAMYKLGVHRTTALVAEAMKRQIISPICIALVAVIAVHAIIDDQPMRRDRRVAERRAGDMRPSRRSEIVELYG